jgi:MFS transporter, PAT family, beta-lactamase induction signal transducer AmpG
MHKRLLIIFILGFSSGLPLALISSTLQAWFADAGMSILATGSLSLLSLPYVYRVIWGPLLDRYSLLSLGKRRSWMLTMQALLLIGFNAMAWLTPASSPKLMAVLAFLLACFSATQDVAIDAHRTEYLPQSEHGLGASLAVFGYRLALLVAGGIALLIASHYGWAITYRLMGFLMLLGMLAALWSPEPSQPQINHLNFAKSFILPVKELCARPGMVTLLFFIIFYKLGEAFTTTTSGIVMPFLIQGLGFSLDAIAYVNKMMGITSILLGGLAAGILLLRWSLYRALFVFGLLQAATTIFFILLAIVGKNTPLFATAVICDNFAAGMGSTALVALFMRLVDRRYTATQFSLLVALATLPRILSGPLAALLQTWFGWVGLYQLAFILALGFIPFLIKLREQVMQNGQKELLQSCKEARTVS